MTTPSRCFPVVATVMSLALAPAGCGDGPRACTEIGCNDGIFLTIEDASGASIDSFSGDVTIGGTTFAVSCTPTGGGGGEYHCVGNTLQLTATEGDAVTVDLTASDDPTLGFAGTVPLQFEESQPNGEGCPPICRQANATVTLVSD